MFLVLNHALSWAITSFGNKFCLKERSRLIKALDNRFHVKFITITVHVERLHMNYDNLLMFQLHPTSLKQMLRTGGKINE